MDRATDFREYEEPKPNPLLPLFHSRRCLVFPAASSTGKASHPLLPILDANIIRAGRIISLAVSARRRSKFNGTTTFLNKKENSTKGLAESYLCQIDGVPLNGGLATLPDPPSYHYT